MTSTYTDEHAPGAEAVVRSVWRWRVPAVMASAAAGMALWNLT